ncbi:pentatricopeptide repeat protein [Striga asiatica]|uniref:Pentatricopeptide repeat protein n=1 Tax=Striga asiatica TaxID=4170 RepID=A0A5A7Q8Z0_STRAF|nr:pentatricopeptide repeat protein [Striga asiatica]
MNVRELLKASAAAKNLRLGKTIHAHLIVSNQISQNRVIEKNSLINFYSKCGDISSARNLFDRMGKKNVVLWCAVMSGYLHHGCTLQVIQMCRDMLTVDKLRPNEYTLSMVLSSCSNCGLLDEGLQCHGFGLKSALIYYPHVKNALVYMYSMWRCGRGYEGSG